MDLGSNLTAGDTLIFQGLGAGKSEETKKFQVAGYRFSCQLSHSKYLVMFEQT